jgi:S-adenosylmethionine:tRNA ribosyltransferase-isomerase
MLLSDYDYDLPENLIAQTPLEDRSASRLLHLSRTDGSIAHRKFDDVPDLFQPGDVLVLNDTRVTALRLFGNRQSGGKLELLLLKDLGSGRFEALSKPAKRLKVGSFLEFENGLTATIASTATEGIRDVDFSESSNWEEKLKEIGQTPLPPYITEKLTDAERYQTVYASNGGSAAAPTAGLHFTQEILSSLESNGVQIARVTLDVGLDTFRPVQAEYLEDHQMHGEMCRIDKANAERINSAKGKIIAVGTTAARTLESYAIGHRKVKSGEMSTQIFIRPGFDFQVIDGMFTNFHLPRTTMLMMISALVNREAIFTAYDVAKCENYRFLSFGDSMLIF